jgi:hypothetical protein
VDAAYFFSAISIAFQLSARRPQGARARIESQPGASLSLIAFTEGDVAVDAAVAGLPHRRDSLLEVFARHPAPRRARVVVFPMVTRSKRLPSNNRCCCS